MDLEIPLISEVQQPPSDIAPFTKLFEEIVDEIVFEMCLTVHKAVKLDYFAYDEFIMKEGNFVLWPSYDEKGNLIVEPPADSSFPSKQTISCSNCGRLSGISHTTQHLDKCMSLGNTARNVRAKEEKQVITETVKKPLPDTVSTFKKLKPEQREERLKMRCCVITKKRRELCKNSLKCGHHTDEQREEVRKYFRAF